MNEVEEYIIETLAQKYDLPVEEVTVDSTLEQLDVDSLTFVEILMSIERRFDVLVPEGALTGGESIREIAVAVGSFQRKVAS